MSPDAVPTRILALMVLPLLGACMTTGGMRSIPRGQGTEVRYAMSPEAVHAALPRALDAVGASVVSDEEMEPVGRMVVAGTGTTPFSYGKLARVLVQPTDSAGGTAVRVVARSKSLLDSSGGAERTAPRLLAALDRALGPGAVQPYMGLHVRGRTSAGVRVSGRVAPSRDGGWAVVTRAGSGPEEVPLDALAEAAALRGTYGHRGEGALVGTVLGFFVGRALPVDECSGPEWCFDGLFQALGGALVGNLVGMAVGSAVRTEVWSPMGER